MNAEVNGKTFSIASQTYFFNLQHIMSSDHARLIRFLQEELAVSPTSIRLALQQCKQELGPLPMVLWQQGVLSLQQLEKTFDWMEMV